MKQCDNFCPSEFTGHWRDWHRGHDCHLDPANATLVLQNKIAGVEAELAALRKQLLSKAPDAAAVIRRTFAAAMLRKIGETMVPNTELNRIIEERLKTALERSREGYEVQRLTERVESLQRTLSVFYAATGVNLQQGWPGEEKIAEAVAAVLSGESYRSSLEGSANRLEGAAREVRKALAAWPQVRGSAARHAADPESGGITEGNESDADPNATVPHSVSDAVAQSYGSTPGRAGQQGAGHD